MTKVIFMGTGAAPGVPAVSKGWGACNPNNVKNRRRRIGTYIEIKGKKFLIDTSPDLRQQLLDNNITGIDAVLYTHAHADHAHGIDDLRELKRISGELVDIYASAQTLKEIKKRFTYLFEGDASKGNKIYRPILKAHEISYNEDIYFDDVKIAALELDGHLLASNGYIFNDGEIVYVADCLEICAEAFLKIKVRPKLLVLPLTTIDSSYTKISHMGLDKLLEYVNLIKPEKTIINHMAAECDYDEVNRLTPANVFPAFDNMVIEI